VKKAKFSDWLRLSLLFAGRGLGVWAGYALFTGVALVLGRVSLALGIFLSVTCLFVGVGVAKYIDLKYTEEHPVGFYWAVNKSLPLAVLAAGTIVIFWFGFMAVANLITGELYKMGQFFFFWELTPENLSHKSTREVAEWIYSYANVTLMFTLLMLTTFASWFSYPLMLFKNDSWSQAIAKGNQAASRNQNALYKMLGFIFAEAILCTTVTPLLTPVLYMLTSTMMYVSYRSIFEADK
jgi:energy-converting hydrogenase Eha subunit A